MSGASRVCALSPTQPTSNAAKPDNHDLAALHSTTHHILTLPCGWKARHSSQAHSLIPENLDADLLTPAMADLGLRRYVQAKRQEAYEILANVIDPKLAEGREGSDGSGSRPSYVVCVSQELLLQNERDRVWPEPPRWLQLVKRLIVEVLLTSCRLPPTHTSHDWVWRMCCRFPVW